MSLVIKFSKFFPENNLKNRLRVMYYNLKPNRKFKTKFNEKYFTYLFKDNKIIKSYKNIAGDLEHLEQDYLRHNSIKEGDVVFDCGGYEGSFSMFISTIVGNKGKIFVFEPEQNNFHDLKKNIELNQFDNITPLKLGIWSSKGKLKISEDGCSSSIFKTKENELAEEISVDKIDSIIKSLNLKKLDFIKMDIEGAEIEALKGAKETLENYSPNVAIASYHIVNGKKTFPQVEDILEKQGYTTKTEGEGNHLTTFGFKKETIPSQKPIYNTQVSSSEKKFPGKI